MKVGFLVAALIATPASASTYTVRIHSETVPEGQSEFREREFPLSSFEEKRQQSDGDFSSSHSSFDLKQINGDMQAKMRTTLSELGAKREGGRIIVELPSDILFDFDKDDIRADARPVLAKLAEVLAVMDDRQVFIIGHTDSRGSETYNEDLSNRRAVSVKEWLLENGLSSKMTTEGRGERFPVAPNETVDGADDPIGRQLNRRVQVIIEEE